MLRGLLAIHSRAADGRRTRCPARANRGTSVGVHGRISVTQVHTELAPTAAPTRSPAKRTLHHIVRTGVVTVTGIIGFACVAWWAIAALAGLSLIVVTTGSMSPTIPTGAVVVARSVPASEIQTGQVVTVPRTGSVLPVTHRVVAVDDVPADREARSLTLRGDANATPDRAPYVVRDAQLTIASAPAVGSVLQALDSRPLHGLLVVVVGAVIIWTFWPPRRKPGAA
ncbi:signal peptidase I [Curtobacterium sp. MCBD17_023]|nr:signal peptidase I [Curtobacterium sp. MCBD17_023]